MKTVLFFLFPILLNLAVISPALSQDDPAELKSFRLEFQAKLANLNQPLTDLDEKYRGYLGKQKETYQQQGKLKAMLAVDEELKNFESPESEKAATSVSTFPELKRLQQIYREQRETQKAAITGPRLALIARAGKYTAELAAKWTKEGKIEEAKRALAESERLAVMEKDAGLATQAGEMLASGPAVRKGSDFAGRNPGEEIRNGKGLKLCWIPAGTFTMGSPQDEPERDADKEAQVEVELTEGFWLGKYEVTQDEYESLIGTNPARFKAAGEDAPVEQVNWNEAMAFCEKLTALEHESGKLPKEWTYSLPTEAQWEYACRAGEPGPFSGGELKDVAWFQENSDGKTHEVGKKKANAWGLHDMHGNVREWCLDWSTDPLAGGQNPTGPDAGTSRIIRGGLYYNEPNYHRAARRGSTSPDTRVHGLGFRVCINFSE